VKIALAQIDPVTGDLEGNADKCAVAIGGARQAGCELVLLPETAITGYMSCDLLEVDAYVRANKELLLKRVCPAVKDLVAVVGFVDYVEGNGGIRRRYNAAALVRDGRIEAVAYKQNLCRYRFFDETRYFTPGSQTTVHRTELGGRSRGLALLICEDLWDEGYPAAPYRDAAKAGADLIISINASPFEVGKWDRRMELIRRHQRRGPLPLLYVNSASVGDNLKDVILFDGRSMAFDARGRMVLCGPMFQEEVLIAELDDELCGGDSCQARWTEEEELYGALTFALRQYCRDTGFSQVVLGVSGGVDSALCAALAARALGPENVLAVSLPTRISSRETRRDAELLCKNLGVDFAVMPIQNLYEQVRREFEGWRNITRQVTGENFQARLRGLLLMGISNETDRMVIATGNKTEIGLGYCTLYGDMVGGMLLIGDVNKMQVYRLARYVNELAGAELIPHSVLTRAPSAELAEDQQDPFDYPVVAPLVDDLIARRDPVSIMESFRRRELDGRYPADLYERYDDRSFAELLEQTHARYHRSAFKRSQASPIVVVSPRSLGFDLRETIINRWCQELHV